MRKGLIVAALMMSISLAALDTTVVVTAIPTIVGSLGGISLLSWVFAIYLLTSTVTVPIYGKLSDIYGRKPVLMFGCVTFLLGSILCGMSGSMGQLIVFRAIQGIGAGAVQPVTLTIIGDLFSIQQRAKIQGLTSSVWGVASIGGPLLGGLITDSIGWRFVFYVNVPFGVTSIILLFRYFHERPEKHEHVLDYLGTALLSGAIISLLLGLLQGVTTFGWTGGPTLGAFVLAAALLALFIYREGKAEEPVLPLWLFRNRVIAVASLVSFIIGTINFGLSSYLPLFVQAVHGGSALRGGVTLAPVSFAWTVASVISARLIVRKGYFPSAFVGVSSTLVGAIILLFVSYSTPIGLSMVAAGFCGFGLGFANSAILISVQNAVSWRFRGVATATNQFFRTIGGSIWVAIMGAVFNSTLSGHLAKIPNIPAGANANTLVNAHDRAAIPATVLDTMRHAVASSLHDVYFLLLLTAVISAATVVIAFPRGGVEALANRDDEAGATLEAVPIVAGD